MRCICPDILKFIRSGKSGLPGLRSLIIKHNLPMFSDYPGGDTYFDVKRCAGSHGHARDILDLLAAGNDAVCRLPTIELLRLSYREL